MGTVVDPIADKSLMTISTVCLALKGLLPGEPNAVHKFIAGLAEERTDG